MHRAQANKQEGGSVVDFLKGHIRGKQGRKNEAPMEEEGGDEEEGGGR